MRVLVTGGKGDLGRRVVPHLLRAGHDVLVGTRSPRQRGDGATEVAYAFADTTSLDDLLRDVDVVVHLASAPQSRTADVEAMRRLVRAAGRGGVDHIVYVSIVGIEGASFPYYRVKLACEQVLADADVPWTILRTTQFHTLVGRYAAAASKLPVVPAARGVPIQPLDPEVVADHVAALVDTGPIGRARDLGGPEVIGFDAAVRAWLHAVGRRRPVVALPIPGESGRAFRRGAILAPGDEAGGRTLADYLDDERDGDVARLRPRAAAPAGVGRFLAVAGWLFVATAVWMAAAPQGFVTTLASFGHVADHFVRDLATFTAPLGIALIMAASRPHWRRPVIGLALVQNGLHLLNHIIDVGTTDPAWHGPVNVVVLAALQVAMVFAFRAVGRAGAPSQASSRVGAPT